MKMKMIIDFGRLIIESRIILAANGIGPGWIAVKDEKNDAETIYMYKESKTFNNNDKFLDGKLKDFISEYK